MTKENLKQLAKLFTMSINYIFVGMCLVGGLRTMVELFVYLHKNDWKIGQCVFIVVVAAFLVLKLSQNQVKVEE